MPRTSFCQFLVDEHSALLPAQVDGHQFSYFESVDGVLQPVEFTAIKAVGSGPWKCEQHASSNYLQPRVPPKVTQGSTAQRQLQNRPSGRRQLQPLRLSRPLFSFKKSDVSVLRLQQTCCCIGSPEVCPTSVPDPCEACSGSRPLTLRSRAWLQPPSSWSQGTLAPVGIPHQPISCDVRAGAPEGSRAAAHVPQGTAQARAKATEAGGHRRGTRD